MSKPKKPSLEALHATHWNETVKLKAAHIGIIKLQWCICNPIETPPSWYTVANVIDILEEHKCLRTGGILYLHPSYLVPPPLTADLSPDEKLKDPHSTQLPNTIQFSAAILGGDKLTMNGQPPCEPPIGHWSHSTEGTTMSMHPSDSNWHIILLPIGFCVLNVLLTHVDALSNTVTWYLVQITQSPDPFANHDTDETCVRASKTKIMHY